ncbi:MAG: Na+/H+ antiporter subunit D, partial [Acidobacteria bacterium]|nr:Na+/H+ antiporter subunit D [Acidobacteriota bacterium]
GESHLPAIFLLLTLASSGTFLHTGLKLPYYMFFAKDRDLRAHEPPVNMLVAMGLAAAACILIGMFPSLLYSHLPFAADYAPYTQRHVTATLGLLGFTALGFFLLLKHLDPEPTISLDTDWIYRRGLSLTLPRVEGALARLEGAVAQVSVVVVQRHLLWAAERLRRFDAHVIDAALVGIGRSTETLSQTLRLQVSGNAHHYGLIMAAGVLAALAIAIFGL